jgi:hypothetical protein
MGGLAVLVLVEQHSERVSMRGVQAELLEIVVEFLDAGLVLDGAIGEVTAARPVGGVFAGCAVDVVETLGLGVVGLEVLVGQGPGRRQAAVVVYHTELLRPEAEQGAP